MLVNNAGLALGVTPVESNDVKSAQVVLDTNVLGTIAICSAFLPGMKERGSGHLITMGSVAVRYYWRCKFIILILISTKFHCFSLAQGHYAYINGSVYNASKYAVRGFTEAARHDLAGTPIRVTHISPGMVGGTEFSNVRLGDDAKASAVYENIEALHPDDVADNVYYAVSVHHKCNTYVYFC